MTTINAQEYLEKKTNQSAETVISSGSLRLLEGDTLTGDMVIQDYPNLEELTLPNHELTSLTVINCPNLKKINVRHNQLTELKIEGENKISELIVGQNELTTLDLTNGSQIKKLIIPDNPLLSKLANLNLTIIKDINITNTSVNLAEDYEKTKKDLDIALESLETLRQGGEEGKLVLTEAIQNSQQWAEGVHQHLKGIETRWRGYFKNPDEALPSFAIPKLKRISKQILILVKKAKNDGNYQELVKNWKEILDQNQGAYDFDGSLDRLEQYMRVQNYFKEKDQKKYLEVYESRQ